MARPLSVGLNLVYLLEQSGGAGTYARELIRGILEVEPDTRLTGFVSSEAPESLLSATWAEPVEWVRFPVRVSEGPRGNFGLTMGVQWGALPLIAARRRIDVVHGLANIAPLVAPRVAKVVTLLDLIWLRFPTTMERNAVVGMKLTAPPSARRADRVIAISHAARETLIERLGLPPERVDVTHLGIRLGETAEPLPEAELRARLDLGDRPVVLCVAQKRVHKNLTGLIRGFAELEEPATLVIPGAPTPHEDEMRALATELGVANRVRLPGWLDAAELEGLYSAAACFVLPSFEEGFGLPVLEAMRRGVPVACSNVSSMPEVAGDAALLFDPEKPGEIAAAVGRLLRDRGLAASLAERGAERCRRFTWEATARATLDVYRRAIAQRRGLL